MSDMTQFAALPIMLFIGAIGIPVLCQRYERLGSDMVLYRGYVYPTKWRIGAAVWIIFWCFPPLTLLWIKGVFG